MANLATLARTTAKSLLDVSRSLGSHALLRQATAGVPRIFMYHRFSQGLAYGGVTPDVFAAQVSYLKRHFRILTMAQLASELQATGKAPRHVAVITIDDGYRDFAEVALPILARAEVPATVYITTGFIDGSCNLWIDEVAHALEIAAGRDISLQELGTLPTATAHQRSAAWQRIIDAGTRGIDGDRLRLIESLLSATGLPAHPPLPDCCAAMGWEQIRDAQRSGIEVGAHTVTHPILSKVDADKLDHEVCASKQRIEQMTGVTPRSFCYPNGQPADIDSLVVSSIKRAGFSNAVVAYFDRGGIRDRFAIRRMGADDDMTSFVRKADGVEWLGSSSPAVGSH